MNNIHIINDTEEIISLVTNKINKCLFYNEKKTYLINKLKSIQNIYSNDNNIDNFKISIKNFITNNKIDETIEINKKNFENLDQTEINNFIGNIKNKIKIQNYLDSTKNNIINNIDDIHINLTKQFITVDKFYNDIYSILEIYNII